MDAEIQSSSIHVYLEVTQESIFPPSLSDSIQLWK